MMENEIFEQWLSFAELDPALRGELLAMADDTEEIADRFYCDLAFGTAGLRGKLGAGTNRMNIYVVARATRALGETILDEGEAYAARGVAIAYDCRIMSREFADLCAEVLTGMGIKVFLFESLRTTPELSFTICRLGCAAGINITASHNPQAYNGYKVYWGEGSQIKSNIANRILGKIETLDIFADHPRMSKADASVAGLLEILGESIDEAFYEATYALSLRGEPEVDKSIAVIYTPLNGTGKIAVMTVLKRMGYNSVRLVPEQAEPDGTFPTTPYPNPEDTSIFACAQAMAKADTEKQTDLIIATDPDCDRLACMVFHDGQWVALSGNQLGILFVDYVLNGLRDKGVLPGNAAIVKSIVTGEMGPAIARNLGVTVLEVLTGFKNICAPANEWAATGEHSYIMGYEESIGYNIGSHLRDKDGVSASLILVEMAGYYKVKNMSLVEALTSLYETYGYYLDDAFSLVLEGASGQARIARMMTEYRRIYPTALAFAKLSRVVDFELETSTDVVSGEIQ